MSDYSDDGEQVARASIIPSARKSIHSEPRYFENMSYNTNLNKCDKGVDEVDNILSKPAHSVSPVPNRKLPNVKDVDDETTDSDSELLDEELFSPSPQRSSSTPSVNKNNSNTYDSCKYRRSHSDIHNLSRSYNNAKKRDSDATKLFENLNGAKNNNTCYVITVAILGILLAVLYNLYPVQKIILSSNYDRFSFRNDIQSLGLQYKIKDDSLLQVQSGIQTISEKQDTGSFIFTYDSNLPNFDPHRFNKFIDNIAWAASRFLRNHTRDVQHVVLDNSKIISLKSDYELIEKFRGNVDNRGVLLVKNIEQIPSKFAMAFHYYCDEFNPLIKKSAIFFTLDVAECSSLSNQKATHAYIEKCLKAKWKDVEGEKIGPLLNRVVNIVVDVMSV